MRRLRSRCQQGWFLVRAVREILFHAPLLAPGGLLAIFGIPWLMGASPQPLAPSPLSLPSFSHSILLRVCICLQISPFFFFFFFKGKVILLFIYLFIYLLMAVLGLRFCARAFSGCGKRGPLLIAVRGPLTIAASFVAEHGLQTRRLSSCGSRAQLLRGMRDPPRPGLEPVSPALAGRFSTTAPPGKHPNFSF